VRRLERCLVGLYPRAWRERYEEEFVAMLEQRPASVSDLVDVAYLSRSWTSRSARRRQRGALPLAGRRVRARVGGQRGWVSVVVSRCEIGARFYGFALFPAALAALAIGVVLVATVVWGLALRARAPALFSGDGGILATPTAATWLAIVAVMAVCACAASAGMVRGLHTRRELLDR
jgi:hypothetical protein